MPIWLYPAPLHDSKRKLGSRQRLLPAADRASLERVDTVFVSTALTGRGPHARAKRARRRALSHDHTI